MIAVLRLILAVLLTSGMAGVSAFSARLDPAGVPAVVIRSRSFITTATSSSSSSSPSSPFSFSLSTTCLFSTTVIEPPTETVQEQQRDDEQQQDTRLPAFLVRLFNDPFNKREFVARCLAEVCGKSDGESFQIMMQAHKQGMGVIGQYDLERAELYVSSLCQQGLLVDMIPVDEE